MSLAYSLSLRVGAVTLPLLLAASLQPAAVAFAATPQQKAQLKSDLTKLSNSIQHLAVNFEQKTYKKLRDRTITEKGRGLFSKPNRFSWKVYERKGHPAKIKKAYYYDGKALDVYSGRENVVTEYASLGSMGQGLGGVVDMVLSPKVLLKSYQVSEVKPKKADGSYQAVLVPAAKQGKDISRLNLVVDPKAQYIRHIKLWYQNGNTIAFGFSKPTFTPIKKTVFEFKGPKSIKRKKAS